MFSVDVLKLPIRSASRMPPLPDVGRGLILCQRDGQPLRAKLWAAQWIECMLEDGRHRPLAGEVKPDATRSAGDDGVEFEEFAA